MRILSLFLVIILANLSASHSGSKKAKGDHDKKAEVDHDKRNFLADAMREMENGERALSPVSAMGNVPKVIRVVMRPEVPPRRNHSHRHGHRHRGSLASILRLAVGLDKARKGSLVNKKAQQDNTENTLKNTVQFLETVNKQLENMSKTNANDDRKMSTEVNNGATAKVTSEVIKNDTFPLLPELRSIVVHGKPFDPDATRAAFARAKQIVWESVGQDPTSADIGHLNNTKLTNAVALLEMAVKEAEKMQRNKTNIVNQGKSASEKVPDTTQIKLPNQRSKQDEHQLKILKNLLLQELKQANYTKDKAGILISDIPFQKLRSNEQVNVMQKLSNALDNSSSESKMSSSNNKPDVGTPALLEKYTSFITNILKAAHLSVLKNLTGDAQNMETKNSTHLSLNTQTQENIPAISSHDIGHLSFEESTRGQQSSQSQNEKEGQHLLSFSNAAQEQKQQQQQQQQQRHFQPFLSRDRLAARKAFGTAQKLVKAFQARQELYKAETDFFNKIHEMLNKTALSKSPNENQPGDSMSASQPTVASPIQSPLSQSPINTANALKGLGEGDRKQTSEAQKKFEEAAHLEEKVAAQQDEMYEALMGHSIGNAKGVGGYDEDGAIHETPEQGDDSYNNEDYGDFKDSDEEAERKFYHDHRQGDFESKAEDDNSFSLRNRISSVKSVGSGSMEFSGIGRPTANKDAKSTISKLYSSFESSGDGTGNNKLASKTYKQSIMSRPRKAHDLIKTYRKRSKSRPKNTSANRRTEVSEIVKTGHPLERDITTTNLRIHVL